LISSVIQEVESFAENILPLPKAESAGIEDNAIMLYPNGPSNHDYFCRYIQNQHSLYTASISQHDTNRQVSSSLLTKPMQAVLTHLTKNGLLSAKEWHPLKRGSSLGQGEPHG
jgi:hypothetical protein